MTDLNSLIIFAEVAQANSFSEAARRLKMPTSTVSRRIADLETQLAVRLIDRSTRGLRLTDVGSELLEHARRTVELSEVIDNIASNHLSKISGTLRLSAPPSISNSLLVPLTGAFQASYPDVRIQIFISERFVDHIADGVDLAFRVGGRLEDSSLVARKILTYRNQLVVSPEYLKKSKPPQTPQHLLDHRLFAFLRRGKPENTWMFSHVNGKDRETITFQPFVGMNDYAGRACELLTGAGIGDLPPIVQPQLLRDGQLIEVMPRWRLRTVNLWLVHLGNRFTQRLQGQQWITLEKLQRTHRNTLFQEGQGVCGIQTVPDFGIGQRALLVRAGNQNILWDCISLMSLDTVTLVNALGGISAIAISHPHYYTSMVEWSRAFDNIPVYLHEDDRAWVQRPDPCIRFWQGETYELDSGLTLIRVGGHFAGFQVLHSAKAEHGEGSLFTGDQPQVCPDRRYVSFMYSYPNFIPLDAASVRRIVAALEPFQFSKLYGAWSNFTVTQNAKDAVRQSARRYVQALEHKRSVNHV